MKKFFGNDFISVADANGIEVYDTTASTWRGVLVRYYYNIECNVYYSYRDGVNIKTRKLSKAEIKTEIRLIIERGERVGIHLPRRMGPRPRSAPVQPRAQQLLRRI